MRSNNTGIDNQPHPISDQIELAKVRMNRKDYLGARLILKGILREDPNNFNALFNIALIKKYTGKYKDAIGTLNSIKGRDETGIVSLELGHVQMSKGFLSLEKNDKEQAIEDMKEALGYFDEMKGKKHEAVSYVEIARTEIEIGRIEKLRGNKSAAQSHFDIARECLTMDLSGDFITEATIPFEMGRLLKAVDDYEGAYRYFDQVYKLPNNIDPKASQCALREIGVLRYDQALMESVATGTASLYRSRVEAEEKYLMEKLTERANTGKVQSKRAV